MLGAAGLGDVLFFKHFRVSSAHPIQGDLIKKISMAMDQNPFSTLVNIPLRIGWLILSIKRHLRALGFDPIPTEGRCGLENLRRTAKRKWPGAPKRVDGEG